MSENKYQNLLNEWNNYNSIKKVNENDKKSLDDCFYNYIDKIKNDIFTLEDYAGKGSTSENCPYFCTFIERKSMNPYGYARVGEMIQYGIYYVSAEKKYAIKIIGIEQDKKASGYKVYTPKKTDIYLYDEKYANEIFEKTIKKYLNKLLNFDVENKLSDLCRFIEDKNKESDDNEINGNLIPSKQFFRKIIAMNNKGKFLFIYNDTIDTVYDYFIGKSQKNESLTNLEKNFRIVEKLNELDFIKQDRHKNSDDFIIELSDFIWKKFNSTLNFESKNMILHGAPGTGKTYMTENSIKNYLAMENEQNINAQFKLQQFHPSFGYEEFIDGIKPVKSKNSTNGIQLELVNGSFKEMCILAFKELIRASKKPNEIPKNYYYVADEINRAELSRVFGELLLCLEEDKRLKIVKKDNKLIVEGTKVQTQNSSLWEKEHAVVILDDENNIVELDENNEYKEDGNKYFGVPENLYFIGTMNDIDRSVDSFDMALRRRFVWKHYTYKKEVLENHYGEKDNLETFLTKCKDLNEYITSEEGFNLPESYMLGHSYFMHLPSFSKEELKKLWSNKIEPLLTEYARVNYEGKELIEKLKIVKEKFILKDKDNK